MKTPTIYTWVDTAGWPPVLVTSHAVSWPNGPQTWMLTGQHRGERGWWVDHPAPDRPRYTEEAAVRAMVAAHLKEER